MKTILKRLQELADADLYALCEAIDQELQRRDEVVCDDSDSIRRAAALSSASKVTAAAMDPRPRRFALSALASCPNGMLPDPALAERSKRPRRIRLDLPDMRPTPRSARKPETRMTPRKMRE